MGNISSFPIEWNLTQPHDILSTHRNKDITKSESHFINDLCLRKVLYNSSDLNLPQSRLSALPSWFYWRCPVFSPCSFYSSLEQQRTWQASIRQTSAMSRSAACFQSLIHIWAYIPSYCYDFPWHHFVGIKIPPFSAFDFHYPSPFSIILL